MSAWHPGRIKSGKIDRRGSISKSGDIQRADRTVRGGGAFSCAHDQAISPQGLGNDGDNGNFLDRVAAANVRATDWERDPTIGCNTTTSTCMGAIIAEELPVEDARSCRRGEERH